MKAYSKPYDFLWATTEVVKQLPTPGFIWPAQLGPPVDRPGGYYDERPHEGVMNGGAPMQQPIAYSGYGAVAPIHETEKIWFTPEVYDDPQQAAEVAAEYAEGFHELGYTVTGVGFDVAMVSDVPGPDTFKGYVLFAGEGPPEAQPLGAEIVQPPPAKTPWWHYGVAAGGGFLFAGLVVAVYNAAIRS